MNRIYAYIKEAYNELLHKVTWPSWNDLQSSSVVVLVASLLIAMVVLVMDIGSDNVMSAVYQLING